MTDHGQITAPRSAQLSARLEEAINNLSLGIVVFDEKREVVFCNERYREMYGLSPEQVKPGTPTSELIRHRLDLGLKVPLVVRLEGTNVEAGKKILEESGLAIQPASDIGDGAKKIVAAVRGAAAS